jgi:hypothetical protein
MSLTLSLEKKATLLTPSRWHGAFSRHLKHFLPALALAFALFAGTPMTAHAAHGNAVIDITGFDFGTDIAVGTWTNWSYAAATRRITVTGDVSVIGAEAGVTSYLSINTGDPVGYTVTWNATSYEGSTAPNSLLSVGGMGKFILNGALTHAAGYAAIQGYGSAMIINNTGVINAHGSYGIWAQTTNTVIIDGGTVTSTNGPAIRGERVWVHGGTVSTTANAANAISSTGTVNLYSGTISAVTGAAIWAENGVEVYGTATVSSNPGTTAIRITDGGGVVVYGVSPGDLTVNGNITVTGDNSIGIRAWEDAEVTVNGDISVTGDNSRGVAANNNSTVNVTGNVSTSGDHQIRAIRATHNATVTVTGNVTAAATAGSDSNAIRANNYATVTVNGNVTATASGNAVVGVNSWGDADVTINGNISASGDQDIWGVSTDGPVAFTINGNVTAAGNGWITGVGAAGGNGNVTGNVTVTAPAGSMSAGIYASNDAIVTVGGNVTAANGLGVNARGIAKVTVNGKITAYTGPLGDGYILITGSSYPAANFTTPTTKAGYLTYTDGDATVWVAAEPAPRDPTYSTTSIPTLSQWTLLLLGALTAAIALMFLSIRDQKPEIENL